VRTETGRSVVGESEMSGEALPGLQRARNLEELSSIYADPLVKAEIVLASSIHSRASLQRCSPAEALKVLSGSLSDGSKLFLVKLENQASGVEAEILVYKGLVVAAEARMGGETLSGSKALAALESVRVPCEATLYTVDLSQVTSAGFKSELERAAAAVYKAPPHAWVGSTLYGLYHVLGVVAGEEGAFSYVLKARDPWGREVALKILKGGEGGLPSERDISKFVAEQATQARLATVEKSVVARMLSAQDMGDVSPDSLVKYRVNIIRVYSVIVPRTFYSSIEEYVESPPLAAMELMDGDITRLGEEAIKRSLMEIISSVGGAMALAHAMGVGHFDVKPLNVLYKRSGSRIIFKLSDFVGYNVTLQGIVVDKFTIEYVDPLLLARRGQNATLDSDVFNFASFTLRLLAGRPSECLAVVNTAIMQLLTDKLSPINVARVSSHARPLARAANKMLMTKPSPERLLSNIEAEYDRCIAREVEAAVARHDIDIHRFLVKALSLQRVARPKNMVEDMMELGLL
jgi:serine/threonine protein kinase